MEIHSLPGVPHTVLQGKGGLDSATYGALKDEYHYTVWTVWLALP